MKKQTTTATVTTASYKLELGFVCAVQWMTLRIVFLALRLCWIFLFFIVA
jgi:hypothetical protein